MVLEVLYRIMFLARHYIPFLGGMYASVTQAGRISVIEKFESSLIWKSTSKCIEYRFQKFVIVNFGSKNFRTRPKGPKEIDGFTILPFMRFEPSDRCIFIGVPSWVFLSSQNLEIWLLKPMCLGYPPGNRKNFLSIIGTFSIYSDRARRADHEKIFSMVYEIVR
jgi:hypothetical protein